MLYTHNGRVVIELKREPIQKTITLSIIKRASCYYRVASLQWPVDLREVRSRLALIDRLDSEEPTRAGRALAGRRDDSFCLE